MRDQRAARRRSGWIALLVFLAGSASLSAQLTLRPIETPPLADQLWLEEVSLWLTPEERAAFAELE
ncbi:MAG: hypothetical protein AAF690_24310, partial [Acidobacteriota bacterium]